MLLVQELLEEHALAFGIIAVLGLTILGCILWASLLCCCASSCLFKDSKRITRLQKYSTASIPLMVGLSIVILCLCGLILLLLTQRGLAQSFSSFENELSNQLNLSQAVINNATSINIENINKELGYTRNFENSLGRVVQVEESIFNPLNIIRTITTLFSLVSGSVLLGFIITGSLLMLSTCGLMSCFISIGICIQNLVGCFACIVILLCSIVLFISPVWCSNVTQIVYVAIYGIMLANECQTDVVFSQLLCQTNGELTNYNPFFSLYDSIQTEMQTNSNPQLPILLNTVSNLANCTQLEDSFYDSCSSCCVGFPWVSFLLLVVLFSSIVIYLVGQPFIHWIVSLWRSTREDYDIQSPLVADNHSKGKETSIKLICGIFGVLAIIFVILVVSMTLLFTLGHVSYLPSTASMTVYTNAADNRFATLNVSEGESITLYGSRNSSGLPETLESVSINTFVDDEDTNPITIVLDFDSTTGMIIKQQDSYGGLITFNWGQTEVTSSAIFSQGNGTSYEASVKHTYGAPCPDITYYASEGYGYGYGNYASNFVPKDDEDEEMAEPNIDTTQTFWTHSKYSRKTKNQQIALDSGSGIPSIEFQVKLTSSCSSEVPTAMVKLWVCEGPTMPDDGPWYPSKCENSYYNTAPKFENGNYVFNVPASQQSVENYYGLNGAENACDAVNWWFCDVPEAYSQTKDIYKEYKQTVLRDGGSVKEILKLRNIPKTVSSMGVIDAMCGSDKAFFGLVNVPTTIQNWFSGVPELCGNIFANSFHDYVFVQAIVTPTGSSEEIKSTGSYMNVIENQGMFRVIPVTIDIAFVEETVYSPNPPDPSEPVTATLKIGCYNKLTQASVSATTTQTGTTYTGTCSPALPTDVTEGTCSIVIKSVSVPGTCGMEMVDILLTTTDIQGNLSESHISPPFDYSQDDIQYCKMRAGTATCPGTCVDADSDGFFRCCCSAVPDPVCPSQ